MGNKVLKILQSPFQFYINLYKDGFKNMSKQSKSLWIIAILKLVIMFGFLKVFFFSNELDRYETNEQKIEHVSKQLTDIKQ